jgi:hypothetical protein
LELRRLSLRRHHRPDRTVPGHFGWRPSVDWLAYYGEFNGAREVLWTYFGGKPHEVPENYIRHSYGHKLKDITTPTLLQIGALDWQYTAPIYQSLRDREIPSSTSSTPAKATASPKKPTSAT